jgi:hypothetical protein
MPPTRDAGALGVWTRSRGRVAAANGHETVSSKSPGPDEARRLAWRSWRPLGRAGSANRHGTVSRRRAGRRHRGEGVGSTRCRRPLKPVDRPVEVRGGRQTAGYGGAWPGLNPHGAEVPVLRPSGHALTVPPGPHALGEALVRAAVSARERLRRPPERFPGCCHKPPGDFPVVMPYFGTDCHLFDDTGESQPLVIPGRRMSGTGGRERASVVASNVCTGLDPARGGARQPRPIAGW